MVYRLLFPLIVVVVTCVYITTSATEDNNGANNEVYDIPINDSILEFFYNCTCVPYYLCSEANRYAFAARANLLPKELYCTNKDFFCCQLIVQPDTTSTEASTEPVAVTTSTVSSTSTTTVTTVTNTTTPQLGEPPNTSTPSTTTEETISVRNPFANQRECGVAKTGISLRILTPDTESAATIPGEVPWIVEIFQKRHNTQRMKCAGSLIHPKVVVTANHCVVSNKPESLTIVATGLERFQNISVNPANERNVLKIIKHPKYNSGRLINDIALLILDNAYNFSNNYLNAICLSKANQTFDGRRCIASGWGRNIDLSEVPLNKVDVPVVNSEQCQNLLRKTSLGAEFDLHPSLLCAGGEEGKDTCKGDGGGPLMCLGDEYQFVLAGMVSWGVDNKCGIVDQPGLYTNVPNFVDWIKEELLKNGLKSEG